MVNDFYKFFFKLQSKNFSAGIKPGKTTCPAKFQGFTLDSVDYYLFFKRVDASPRMIVDIFILNILQNKRFRFYMRIILRLREVFKHGWASNMADLKLI